MAFNQQRIWRKSRFEGSWVQNLLGTTLAPPATPKIFRGPIITKIWRLSALAALLAQPPPNILATTLTTAPVAPFSQTEWPNPRGKPFPIEGRTHTDPLKLNLLNQDRVYGDPGQVPTYDWQNPRGKIPAISLRTHTESLKIHLLVPFSQTDWPNPKGYAPRKDFVEGHLPFGRDQFFGEQGQFPTYDYPNPQLQVVRRQDFVLGMMPPEAAPPAAPFNATDWPNPRGPQPVNKGFVAGNLPFGKDQFFGEQGQPPANLDQPNPILRTVQRQDFVQGMNPPEPTAVQAPFRQLDWPNPTLPKGRNVVLLTFLQGGGDEDTFFGDIGQPPANLNQPNPIRRVVPRQDFIRGVIPPEAAPEQPPFAQYSWPTPARFFFGGELKTFTHDVQRQLIGQDALPARLADWQNPQPKRYPQENRGFIKRTDIDFIPPPSPVATGTQKKRKWRRGHA